ncbi:uncharacterized protein EV154DRAFT_488664 [Mucor mucedo]|uniref:uncharacterized protein n=1 Tax=Mucor mucedo TaxID=29922 RepID=UPI002220D927|nr:uncharacterized protein EV154DRAFT_488664 [Mucor mucedo]KAI7865824.1 hypothetical protein EV154DRAFT_488664 [Mucor mucedo]
MLGGHRIYLLQVCIKKVDYERTITNGNSDYRNKNRKEGFSVFDATQFMLVLVNVMLGGSAMPDVNAMLAGSALSDVIALLGGNALLGGKALLSGKALLTGKALLSGKALLTGNALLGD